MASSLIWFTFKCIQLKKEIFKRPHNYVDINKWNKQLLPLEIIQTQWCYWGFLETSTRYGRVGCTVTVSRFQKIVSMSHGHISEAAHVKAAQTENPQRQWGKWQECLCLGGERDTTVTRPDTGCLEPPTATACDAAASVQWTLNHQGVTSSKKASDALWTQSKAPCTRSLESNSSTFE